MKATGCPKAFGSRPSLVFLENQLFPLQFKHLIFSNLQTPHEAVGSVVYGSGYPDVSMADSGQEMFSHKHFIFVVSFIEQLAENDTLPRTIRINPNILQYNR
jgi:hypothetical protein